MKNHQRSLYSIENSYAGQDCVASVPRRPDQPGVFSGVLPSVMLLPSTDAPSPLGPGLKSAILEIVAAWMNFSNNFHL